MEFYIYIYIYIYIRCSLISRIALVFKTLYSNIQKVFPKIPSTDFIKKTFY